MTESLFATYYPLFLVIEGTILNFITLFILFRSNFRDQRKQTTICFMRAIVIFDILMLYGWNLDHYVSNAYGFLLQRYSIPVCKILSFLNYFAAQSSAWLRVFMCFDRYVSLGRLYQTWFDHSKNVFWMILSIILVFSVLNCHIVIFACFYTDDGTLDPNSRFYQIYPKWDYVNLIMYNCLPFLFMVIFNSGVIYYLIDLRRSTTIQNSRIHHRAISITLVIHTFLFLLMTIPGTLAYAFFYQSATTTVLHLLDSILYTYHTLSFPLYFITFREFRRECLSVIRLKNNRRSSSIQSRTPPCVINEHRPAPSQGTKSFAEKII